MTNWELNNTNIPQLGDEMDSRDSNPTLMLHLGDVLTTTHCAIHDCIDEFAPSG